MLGKREESKAGRHFLTFSKRCRKLPYTLLNKENIDEHISCEYLSLNERYAYFTVIGFSYYFFTHLLSNFD